MDGNRHYSLAAALMRPAIVPVPVFERNVTNVVVRGHHPWVRVLGKLHMGRQFQARFVRLHTGSAGIRTGNANYIHVKTSDASAEENTKQAADKNGNWIKTERINQPVCPLATSDGNISLALHFIH